MNRPVRGDFFCLSTEYSIYLVDKFFAMNISLRSGLLSVSSVLSLIILSSVSRCNKEEEAQLQLEVIESTSDATSFSYHSITQPIGVYVKEYYIYTDFDESLVRMQCTNCRNIRIETSLSKPHVDEEYGYSTSIEATAEETGIFVTVADNNVLCIDLKHLDPDNSLYGYYATVKVYGKIDGVDKYSTVYISRRSPSLTGKLNKDK